MEQLAVCGVLQAGAGELSEIFDDTARRRQPEQAESSTWDIKRLTTSKRTKADKFDGAVAATTDNVLSLSACEHCKLLWAGPACPLSRCYHVLSLA